VAFVPHGQTSPAETEPVAMASTWINPKLKQAGGPSARAGGSLTHNTSTTTRQSAGAPDSEVSFSLL
jgi:hypothetical protein